MVVSRAPAQPLLEFTLDQLFERREGRCLTAAAYYKCANAVSDLSSATPLNICVRKPCPLHLG
jgi:hypothetical protein